MITPCYHQSMSSSNTRRSSKNHPKYLFKFLIIERECQSIVWHVAISKTTCKLLGMLSLVGSSILLSLHHISSHQYSSWNHRLNSFFFLITKWKSFRIVEDHMLTSGLVIFTMFRNHTFLTKFLIFFEFHISI